MPRTSSESRAAGVAHDTTKRIASRTPVPHPSSSRQAQQPYRLNCRQQWSAATGATRAKQHEICQTSRRTAASAAWNAPIFCGFDRRVWLPRRGRMALDEGRRQTAAARALRTKPFLPLFRLPLPATSQPGRGGSCIRKGRQRRCLQIPTTSDLAGESGRETPASFPAGGRYSVPGIGY